MRVLISGAHGFIGSALIPFLQNQGHSVVALERAVRADSGTLTWNPPVSGPAPEALEGFETLIHLAGESVAALRWSAQKKSAIRQSRVDGTRLLTEAVLRMKRLPRTVICASAVGFYGDRGDEVLDEQSAAGQGFLPEVCQAWEKAAAPLRERGVRLLSLRLGVVLSRSGGALALMRGPFACGLGAVLGSGRQFMPWVTLEDVLSTVAFALAQEKLDGPINLVAPEYVTQAQFAKTLGRALRRPVFMRVPAFVLKTLCADMARETLLASARVAPQALVSHGYRFRHPTLAGALKAVLSGASV